MADYRVTPMTAEHAQAVLVIYQEGADTGDATFDDEAPDWAPFDADHLPEHRFVATDATGQVLGWIAAAAVSARRGYAGVIEHSVCVAGSARGRGGCFSTALLRALIESSEKAESGRSNAECFPRTPPAWPCTRVLVSVLSGHANDLADTTTAGAMSFCWNAAAPASGNDTDQRSRSHWP